MSRRLITRNNIHDFVSENCLILEKGMLLSPGADDYAKIQSIQVMRSSKTDNKQLLSKRICTLLRQEFNITDPDTIAKVQSKVLNLISL